MTPALQNDHNVYILGAGFSREANMPLIRDFLVRIRDSHGWLLSQNRPIEADAVQKVLSFRLGASSAAYWTQLDLENIEELFSLASSSSRTLTGAIQLAIAATLDHAIHFSSPARVRLRLERSPFVDEKNPAVVRVPWLEFQNVDKQYSMSRYVHHVGKLLGMFRDGSVKGENTFITFNYDTVLERALEGLGVEYGYALPEEGVEFHETSNAKRLSAINVLKLHGSINWARGTPDRRLLVYGDYPDVRRTNAVPELVPPTWKKVFEDQLAHVWEQAVAALQSATRVVVIGFSIPPTDTHFKYLLAAGLQQNISLRQITFFNLPDAIGELKDRASSLLRREYIQNGLISFRPQALGDLVCDNGALQAIGRPFWKSGDKTLFQTE